MHTATLEDEAGSATLALAAFDEHLLDYADRSDVLDPKLATAVDPARNSVFRAVRLNPAKRKRITLALEPWGAFVGREVEVRFGD